MEITKFESWVENQVDEAALATSKARMPTDKLGRGELSKEIAKEGDIVEIGKNTQHKGHPMAKLGKIVHIGNNQVTVEPFLGKRMQIIPIDNLLWVDSSPTEKAELARVGANSYWKFRTKKQIPSEEKRLAKQAKERAADAARTSPLEMDDKAIRHLKLKLFGNQFFNPSKPKDVQADTGPNILSQLGGVEEPPKPSLNLNRPGPLANYKNRLGGMSF